MLHRNCTDENEAAVDTNVQKRAKINRNCEFSGKSLCSGMQFAKNFNFKGCTCYKKDSCAQYSCMRSNMT